MPRSYHLATAALAIGCEPRWLDNLLTQHDVPGVVHERRGVSRQLTLESLLLILVARRLLEDLGLAAGRALALAHELCASQGRVVHSSGLSVHVDLTRLRREMELRLLDAVESNALPRRGRPRRTVA